MRAKIAVLVAVAAYALLALLAVAQHAPSAIRAPLAVPLIFILPGLAVSAALGQPEGHGFAERATVSVGASLAIAAVGALVLNLTPWGLRAVPWTTLLAGVTLAGTAVALARMPLRARGPRRPIARPPLAQGSLFALAAGIAALGGVVAWQGALRQATPGFTQLWLEQGAHYGTASIGVTNHEHKTLEYRAELSAGDSLVADAGPFVLNDGATWQATLPLAQEIPGRPITASLYRLDQPDRPYRQATLWPPTPPATPAAG